MNRMLPPNPNLTQLKHQAKDLLKAHERGDTSVCDTLRLLGRFSGASDGEILSASLSLHETQFAIALDYGSSSWNALKQRLEENRTPSTGQLIRQDGRVWIDGILPLAYGQSGVTTYAGALEAALTATSHPYCYDDIMGYTGLAFRTRWYRRLDTPGWCPSCAVGEFGPEIHKTEAATGWRFELVHRMEREDDPHMEDFSEQMVAAIESGFPVVGYSNRRILDCAVAYGYKRRNDGVYFLWQGYNEEQSGWKHESETGPQLIIPIQYDSPVEQRVSLRRAFSEDWRQRAHPANNAAKGITAEYRYGTYALETWADDLVHHDDFTEEQRASLFFVSWFAHSTLICARAAAARFLTGHSKAEVGEVAQALRHAATLYGETSALVKKAQKEGAFRFPFVPNARDQWTPQARKLEIDTLHSVQQRDSAAERELDRALMSMEANLCPRGAK